MRPARRIRCRNPLPPTRFRTSDRGLVAYPFPAVAFIVTTASTGADPIGPNAKRTCGADIAQTISDERRPPLIDRKSATARCKSRVPGLRHSQRTFSAAISPGNRLPGDADKSRSRSSIPPSSASSASSLPRRRLRPSKVTNPLATCGRLVIGNRDPTGLARREQRRRRRNDSHIVRAHCTPGQAGLLVQHAVAVEEDCGAPMTIVQRLYAAAARSRSARAWRAGCRHRGDIRPYCRPQSGGR